MSTSLVLRRLAAADEEQVLQAVAELAAEGGHWTYRYRPDLPWADYVALVNGWEVGTDLPEGFVTHAELVAEADGQIVGRSSIRYELNDFLRTLGGHVGYAVRPQFRGRGHAKEILRLSLAVLDDRGIDPVLVTCDDDNIASARVIEANGGLLDDIVMGELGTMKRRYWISASAGGPPGR